MADTVKHILTDTEALAALRFAAAEEVPDLELLQSAVDDGIKTETGFDWATLTTTYTVIDPTAKLAARLMLICMFEGIPLPDAYRYKIVQLDAKAKEMAANGTT
jgi:hypothetical protein